MEKCLSSTIKLLLVDDHSIIRAGYQQILQRDPSVKVIAEAESSFCAVAIYAKVQPDVVVMDLSIPQKKDADEVSSTCGIETIRKIIQHDEKAKILVLTALSGDPYPSQAFSAGALGYLTKHCAPNELIEAVRSVYAGQRYLSAAIKAELNTGDESTNSLMRLSQRELEVFSMLAESHPIAKIADVMHLSPKTVHAHRANILRKLELKNNADIVRLAVRQGLIET
ncbi:MULTISPECIES: response regulator [Nitrincola]|uniref:Response regulator uvrY n=1 Tax=Nitrincola nitratireducens TaxID=1229521 RepID=W9UXC3_9GAMM|nr:MULTISPECIES: response regulator transcription factor [Nitrincola]EXJ11888.1 Response regulator uvrY [Nitrincola nitratireducens]